MGLFAQLLGWCRNHRKALIALMIVLALSTPRPAQAQFGLPVVGIIVGALNAINSAITNVIGGALQAMNQTLATINGIVGAVHDLFQNVVYPRAAISRAQDLVSQVMGIYNQIRAIAQTAVNSASLVNPRTLEQTLLSRNPLQIGNVDTQFQAVYQPLPPATDASFEARNMIDMSDAAAQAAMKRAIAIDAIADQELTAAEQMLAELRVAAPGTAPMIGAQGAAWLVRAHAYTQAALAESIRLRAIDLANAGAELKFNAGYGASTRQDTGATLNRR
jgi:hypothetical protein